MTLRAIGATVVLTSIALIALLQIDNGGAPEAIVLEPDVTTSGEHPNPAQDDTATEQDASGPFTYRMGVLAPISTDNFWAFYGGEASVWNAYVLGPTKPALYTVDPLDGSIKPELAEATTDPIFEDGGWSVQVSLNGSMNWSDGEPITAHDVVFTFNTVRSLELGGSWKQSYPASVESMTAISESELRIDFVDRPNIAVWPHGPGLAPIMPAHVWGPRIGDRGEEELYEMSGSFDVGGGPLVLRSYDDESSLSEVNPGYSLGVPPARVEYRVFADEAHAARSLSTGDIDYVLTPNGLTHETISAVSNVQGIEIVTSPANGVRYLGFNTTRAPMSDIQFRKALALLLDREALAESITANGSVAHSFVSPANEQWFDSARARSNMAQFSGPLATRLESALLGLRRAGYEWEIEPTVSEANQLVAGVGLKMRGMEPGPLTILTPGDAYDPTRREYAGKIAETLARLGFVVRPIETDFDTVVDLAFAADGGGEINYDMYLLGWTLGNPALPDYYRTLFASDGAMNNTGYASSEFDGALSDYEAAHTVEEARQALWVMEAKLAEELPYLLLYTVEITEAYRADRVTYGLGAGLGGIQARLGGVGDVQPAG